MASIGAIRAQTGFLSDTSEEEEEEEGKGCSKKGNLGGLRACLARLWRWVLVSGLKRGMFWEIWFRRDEQLFWKVVKACWRLTWSWGCLGGGKVVGFLLELLLFIFPFFFPRRNKRENRGSGFFG